MTELLDGLPTWLRLLGATVALAALAAALLAAYHAGRRGGRTRIEPARDARQRTKDRALFAAALAAGITVYAAIVIGSYEGLTAFAEQTIGWTDWKRSIVPVTLDGAAAAFGFLAFRAVARNKSPYRCYAIVWASAGASATFNFTQGGERHALAAGLYLAFLSIVGMSMFHTFLDQFAVGAELVRHRYPRFGLRWLTYSANTVCAALAWINHPPAADVEPSVPAAVAHLDQVRAAKRAARLARRAEAAQYPPAWTRLVPGARARHLAAALQVARDAAAVELAEMAARLDRVAAEFEAAERARTEQVERAERIRAEQAERAAALEAERDAERARAEQAEHLAERIRAEQAERAADRVAEQSPMERPERATERPAERVRRSAPVPARQTRRSTRTVTAKAELARPSNAPRMTDEQALDALLAAHPEPGYVWSQREVHRITGAGFTRIAEKLLPMLAEYHAAQAEQMSGTDRSTTTTTTDSENGATE